MTMHQNGVRAAEWEDEATHYSNPEWEDEASHYSNPYSNPEQEWETQAATHYSNPEFEDEASHYSNPYSNPEASQYSNPYSNPEQEWEGEATHYSNPEWEDEASLNSNPYSNPEQEWETQAATHYSNPEFEDEASHYSNPYSNPEASQYSNPYSNPEQEWEGEATHYSNPESEDEASQYSNPYSNPEFEDEVVTQRARPIRLSGRPAVSGARLLIPCGRTAVDPVVGAVLGRAGRRSGVTRRVTILLNEGEGETTELEARLFGANEFEGELAPHESAHEAALTEVLAAEAAHTESESEAQALLGAALPITIRIMGGGGVIRRVAPTLARANARLVRSLRQRGSAGRQLVRLVPSIQRRTVASLRAAQRQGRPVTPSLAAQVMAGQAARVLGRSRLCGRGLVRNAAIRRATVAPARRIVRRSPMN